MCIHIHGKPAVIFIVILLAFGDLMPTWRPLTRIGLAAVNSRTRLAFDLTTEIPQLKYDVAASARQLVRFTERSAVSHCL